MTGDRRERVTAVWEAVTQAPGATVRALADTTNLPATAVYTALQYLERLGHISARPRLGVARTIHVAFCRVSNEG